MRISSPRELTGNCEGDEMINTQGEERRGVGKGATNVSWQRQEYHQDYKQESVQELQMLPLELMAREYH